MILVEEVAQRTRVKHMFDEVALAVGSQNPYLLKIQGQLADKHALEFKEESIPGRADRLRARLMAAGFS